MGNPMSGEIYEGGVRAGDVSLTGDEATRLREMSEHDRIQELRSMLQVKGAQAQSEGGVLREMPRYQCHKKVWALKIADIQARGPKTTIAELEDLLSGRVSEGVEIRPDGAVLAVTGAIITPADEGFAPFEVDGDYCQKHPLEVGGYYVVYADGYRSYSPAQPFEEGYTRI